MKETALYRAKWIRSNNTKSILEILTEYPCLTSAGMVWDHWNILHALCIPYLGFKGCPFIGLFKVMHGEAAPKLFDTWLADYTAKVLQLAKKAGKLPSLDVDDMTPGKLKLTIVCCTAENL